MLSTLAPQRPAQDYQFLRLSLCRKGDKGGVLVRRIFEARVGEYPPRKERTCNVCGIRMTEGRAFGYHLHEISPKLQFQGVSFTFRACPMHQVELAGRMMAFIKLLQDPHFLQQHNAYIHEKDHRIGKLDTETWSIVIDHTCKEQLEVLFEALKEVDFISRQHTAPIRSRVKLFWHRNVEDKPEQWMLEFTNITGLAQHPRCSICGRTVESEAPGYVLKRLGDFPSLTRFLWEFCACPQHKEELEDKFAKALALLNNHEFLSSHLASLAFYREKPYEYIKIDHEGSSACAVVEQAFETAGIWLRIGGSSWNREIQRRKHLWMQTPEGQAEREATELMRLAAEEAARAAKRAQKEEEERQRIEELNERSRQACLKLIDFLAQVLNPLEIQWEYELGEGNILVVTIGNKQVILAPDKITRKHYRHTHPDEKRLVLRASGGKKSFLKQLYDAQLITGRERERANH